MSAAHTFESPREERLAVARALTEPLPGVDARVSLVEVSEHEFGATEADSLAVLESGRPIGLITRQALTSTLSARFGHALFGRDPIASVADRDALVIAEGASLESCLRMAFERSERRAYDDLIVVDAEGRYLGMISVKGLVLHQTSRLAEEQARKREAEARSRQLEEVAELKTRFLASMTHELRAPLNTILGLAELIPLHVEAGRTARAAEQLHALRSTATHLRALVDNVLDQAKLDAGRMQVVEERVELGRLLHELSETARVLALPEVEVRVELPEAPVSVMSDPVKIRQILMNLVSNAAKLTERGAITLRLTPLPKGAELAVTDTGPGIAEAHLPLLFSPFTQLAEVSTRRHGGTGLGLSLSKQLAELLAGGLRVDTRLGHGTTMTLRLPEERDCP